MKEKAMSDLDRTVREADVHEDRLARRLGAAAVTIWPDLNRYLKDTTTLEAARELDGTAADQSRD